MWQRQCLLFLLLVSDLLAVVNRNQFCQYIFSRSDVVDQVWREADTPDGVAICCTLTSPQRIVHHVLQKLVAQ